VTPPPFTAQEVEEMERKYFEPLQGEYLTFMKNADAASLGMLMYELRWYEENISQAVRYRKLPNAGGEKYCDWLNRRFSLELKYIHSLLAELYPGGVKPYCPGAVDLAYHSWDITYFLEHPQNLQTRLGNRERVLESMRDISEKWKF
jgi:hypothetical protein